MFLMGSFSWIQDRFITILEEGTTPLQREITHKKNNPTDFFLFLFLFKTTIESGGGGKVDSPTPALEGSNY